MRLKLENVNFLDLPQVNLGFNLNSENTVEIWRKLMVMLTEPSRNLSNRLP